MVEVFADTTAWNLVYVYAIRDVAHKGYLKVGKATCTSDLDLDDLTPGCRTLNAAARKRIDGETQTAGVAYELLYTELAVRYHTLSSGKSVPKDFKDTDVHDVLKRSGIPHKYIGGTKGREWFQTDLKTVKAAIRAVKQFRPALDAPEIEPDAADGFNEFRAEQNDAIAKTLAHFKSANEMLWDAKMRFGKTLASLDLVRQGKFRRTIIVTHRPVVGSGWQKDFNILFKRHPEAACTFHHKNNLTGSYTLSAKTEQANDAALRRLDNEKRRFVYFASIQDLRGSQRVGGKYAKNEAVFDMPWDLVIIDEAHEGTQTDLGERVRKELIKKHTKVLSLSGTPFNIRSHFKDVDAVFTWDYVSEQNAKAEWPKKHPDEPNPYEALPRLNIYTYDLSSELHDFSDTDLGSKAFNFDEFFRTWTGDATKDGRSLPAYAKVGEFVHSESVRKFLDLISADSDKSRYPFSTPARRELFRHTFWVVPGVKEAAALAAMLRSHPVFKKYEIVNAAGAGDGYGDLHFENDLRKVEHAIENNRLTITLSCGKLTTGVTVPEWTGVLLLAGSASASAARYMQTIFRVQSPGTIGGKMKTDCYAFDFAPDRTLKVIADTASIRPSTPTGEETNALAQFLNFCPVLAFDGARMQEYDVGAMMKTVKRILINRAIRNGFDDESVYATPKLMNLTDQEFLEFEQLRSIIGASKGQPPQREVTISESELDKEVRKKEKQSGTPLTAAEREELRLKMKRRKEKERAISTLRAISIRMPLMIYGANVALEKPISVMDIPSLVDDASWEVFMPRGATKEIFRKYARFWDDTIVSEAGLAIRQFAKKADALPPLERVEEIARIFGYFKNPDKETVQTPWKTVQAHLAAAYGAATFMSPDSNGGKNAAAPYSPRILEINSKTGLYPLAVAAALYRERIGAVEESAIHPAERLRIWDKACRENVYVLALTDMAKAITQRTLGGFRNIKTNIHVEADLIMTLKRKGGAAKAAKKILESLSIKDGFSAVVGNPPYQEVKDDGNKTFMPPVYHHFYDLAFELAPKVSLITPGKFLFNAGDTPKDWNRKVLSDTHFKVLRYEQNSTEFFPNVDIKGGVAITLRDTSQTFDPIGTYIAFPELRSIAAKVSAASTASLESIIYAAETYHFTQKMHDDLPQAEALLSKGHKYDFKTSILSSLADVAFFEENPRDGHEYVQILGLIKNVRAWRWIRRDYVEGPDNFDKFKVFVPAANGTGAIGEVLSTPLIGEPLIGVTQTFISIGCFATRREAENCMKYVKTKFARTMLGVLKITQHNPKEKWRYVPLVDFNEEWTDARLYERFGLDDREIAFIEEKVRPME